MILEYSHKRDFKPLCLFINTKEEFLDLLSVFHNIVDDTVFNSEYRERIKRFYNLFAEKSNGEFKCYD